ncbi:MAG: hypothetical protein WCY77_09860 [Weeksellaceae bacterium]
MSLTINPEFYLVRHQKGVVPMMNLQISVSYDGTWYLHNDPSMIFVMDGENVPEIQSSGTESVYIRLTNQINSWDEGLYELKLKAFNFDSTEEKVLTIYLILTESDEDVIIPKKLIFESIRNVVNSEPQKIFIATADSNVVVQLPEFLQLVDHTLIGGGHIVIVKPVMHSLTPLSYYSDDILIDLPSEIHQKKVRVNYKINAGYDESYSKSVHFTRDNDELLFYQTTTEKSFLKLIAIVKSFKTTGELHQEIELDLDLPFVNYRAKLNLGLELEGYFEKAPNSQVFTNYLKGVYPPMQVDMVAIEIKNDDYSILNQSLIEKQIFLCGRIPVSALGNKAFWLNFRPSVMRFVSNQSIISLSIFKPSNTPIKNIIVYKNGEFLRNITPVSQTFGLMNAYYATANLALSNLNLEAGDELSFQYENIYPHRKFLIRPNPKNSFLVVYETIWKTMEIIEFTGAIKFDVEYEHDIFEYSKNYVLHSEKVRSTNPQKVIINTGWIQKNEVYLINELISSNQAILHSSPKLVTPDIAYSDEQEGMISLVPIQSKMTNYDSDEERYQFDVEFLINKKYEDPIYSR